MKQLFEMKKVLADTIKLFGDDLLAIWTKYGSVNYLQEKFYNTYPNANI
jgi:hypothetical protein